MASDPIGTVRFERHDDGHSVWVRIDDPITEGAEWTCVSSTAPRNVGCMMGTSLAGWARVIGAVPGTPAAVSAERAVSSAVASAHLSDVDLPADHVETVGKVARGEVTADDAVQALVDSNLRDRIADDLAEHTYRSSGSSVSCSCETWTVDRLWAVDWADQWLMHVAESIVDFRVAPMLAAKDEERDEALRKLALAEAAVEPAGNALVDLVEARRLLRERNRAYGRASATIGELRGQLARRDYLPGAAGERLRQASHHISYWQSLYTKTRAELEKLRADSAKADEDERRYRP